jgi:serine/threonine-protein kinase HipA
MKTLQVIYHGRSIGELQQTDSGRLGFAYSPAWLNSNQKRPLSYSLPLREAAFDERECIGFFGGLLPEERNRDVIAKNLGITSKNDFAMLKEIGGECAGAISLMPIGEPINIQEPKYTYLSERELEAILLQLPQTPLLAGSKEIRLSLAGAQNKLALFKDDKGFALPLNESPSSHILKPDSQIFPKLVENEAYCLWLAAECGLPTAEAEITETGDQRSLLIKRYDRTIQNNQWVRLHQEDFCQALGISSRIKYQAEGGPGFANCFDLIRKASAQPARDLITLFEASIFNYLIGNNDAHGKNFSLLYTPIGERFSARLAPLYDLVCTTYFEDLSPRMAMKIGKAYHPSELRLKHWEAFWETIGFSKRQALKRSLDFADRVSASMKTSLENEVEVKIQEIIAYQVTSLRTTLKQA